MASADRDIAGKQIDKAFQLYKRPMELCLCCLKYDADEIFHNDSVP